MTATYTAAELIAAGKAYIAADAERMSRRPAGFPRAGWAMQNPVDMPTVFRVRDTALNTRPLRHLSIAFNGNPYDLIIWSVGARPGCVARINLRAPDADQQLARFERI